MHFSILGFFGDDCKGNNAFNPVSSLIKAALNCFDTPRQDIESEIKLWAMSPKALCTVWHAIINGFAHTSAKYHNCRTKPQTCITSESVWIHTSAPRKVYWDCRETGYCKGIYFIKNEICIFVLGIEVAGMLLLHFYVMSSCDVCVEPQLGQV